MGVEESSQNDKGVMDIDNSVVIVGDAGYNRNKW